jgi:hypothetical protein
MANAQRAISAPRLFRRERAAAYLDISASSFDKLVRDGFLPPAKLLHSFKVWDRDDLDAMADRLPYDGVHDKPDASWDD